jgi:uncharacterized protein YegL
MAIKTVGSNDAQNIKDVIQTKDGDQVMYDEDIVAETVSEGVEHQPIVISVDGSVSMNSPAGNGKTKKEVVVGLINNLPQAEQVQKLNAVEKGAVDTMVLSFSGNDVYVESKWEPLSVFEGISGIKDGSTTPLYKAIGEAIQASRVLRHSHSEKGVTCRRPQIFIFTDGMATDAENRAEAKKLCEKYASKENCRVKIHVVLIPGAMTEEQSTTVAADLIDLCDNIAVVKVDDCVNGLPAAFEFLTASAVVGVSSVVGDELKVKYDTNHMQFACNTQVQPGGTVITGTQDIWKTAI